MERKHLTDKQCLALKPYLLDLLARYQDVADTGMSAKSCALCDAAPNDCTECPLFSDGGVACGDYMIDHPKGLIIRPISIVRYPSASIIACKAWGCEMVALLRRVEQRLEQER